MIQLPWLQLTGAIAGGIVGGFSGFVANNIRERQLRRWMQRNVASALVGEIEAISNHIENFYLALIRGDADAEVAGSAIARHRFRAERDYMPVFRSIGANIGYLPAPLPRELVSWYTGFGVGLERAHALYELAVQGNPDLTSTVNELAQVQQAAFIELVARAKPLVERLTRL
jgi:hypothetical protein